MTETKKDNVLNVKFTGKKHSLKRKKRSICNHWNLEVDENSRRVFCLSCNNEVDPITVLIEFAMLERKMDYNRNELYKIVERISKLKIEEKNAKARIKRLNNQ